MLGFNRLHTLPPGLFDENRKLKVLDMGANRLTDLPPHIFDFAKEVYLL